MYHPQSRHIAMHQWYLSVILEVWRFPKWYHEVNANCLKNAKFVDHITSIILEVSQWCTTTWLHSIQVDLVFFYFSIIIDSHLCNLGFLTVKMTLQPMQFSTLMMMIICWKLLSTRWFSGIPTSLETNMFHYATR